MPVGAQTLELTEDGPGTASRGVLIGHAFCPPPARSTGGRWSTPLARAVLAGAVAAVIGSPWVLGGFAPATTGGRPTAAGERIELLRWDIVVERAEYTVQAAAGYDVEPRVRLFLGDLVRVARQARPWLLFGTGLLVALIICGWQASFLTSLGAKRCLRRRRNHRERATPIRSR